MSRGIHVRVADLTDAAKLREMVRQMSPAQRRLLVDAIVDVVVEATASKPDQGAAIRRELSSARPA